MASSSLITELSKRLQCAICLETVCNPKNLSCNHSYCKHCLDRLLKFNPNGSASIKCPQGCKNMTKISCKQTTNDLGVNYMLKDILDVTVVEKGDGLVEKPKCETCTRDIKKYCIHCELFKCQDCPDVHNDTDDSFLSVSFHAGQKKMVMVCIEHTTEATYLCCDSKYVCIYCVHRGHKSHEYETLVDVEKSLKGVITEEIKKRDQTELKKDILDVKCSLEKALQINKLKCMSEYSDYLDKEEESIIDEFKLLSGKQTTAFDSAAYLQQCLSKEGSHFVLERNKIMTKLKCIDESKTIPGVAVSLTESKFNGEHPLGCLSVVHDTHLSGLEWFSSFGSFLDDPDHPWTQF